MHDHLMQGCMCKKAGSGHDLGVVLKQFSLWRILRLCGWAIEFDNHVAPQIIHHVYRYLAFAALQTEVFLDLILSLLPVSASSTSSASHVCAMFPPFRVSLVAFSLLGRHLLFGDFSRGESRSTLYALFFSLRRALASLHFSVFHRGVLHPEILPQTGR